MCGVLEYSGLYMHVHVHVHVWSCKRADEPDVTNCHTEVATPFDIANTTPNGLCAVEGHRDLRQGSRVVTEGGGLHARSMAVIMDNYIMRNQSGEPVLVSGERYN